MTAVVLLSGGMDSTTALFQALADGAGAVFAVTTSYGSKHSMQEMNAARKVVEWANKYGHIVHQTEVALPDVFSGAGSALMGESDMPNKTYQEIAQEVGPSPTVVPFRNANLISVATALAVRYGADVVYVGVHAEDARNFAYPDCSVEFMGAMANAVWVGTYHKVRLIFPFIWMTKDQIVTRAALLGAPLHLTWSCYEGMMWHCGKCPTCVERIAAFQRAGYKDPVKYCTEIGWGKVDSWPVA